MNGKPGRPRKYRDPAAILLRMERPQFKQITSEAKRRGQRRADFIIESALAECVIGELKPTRAREVKR